MTKADQEFLISVIQLIRTKNVGNITFFRLLEKFKTIDNALANLEIIAKNSKNQNLKVYPRKLAEKEFFESLEQNIKLISFMDENYPPLLKHLEDAPPLLFVKGDSSLMKKMAISVVGARNASINAQSLSYSFAKELGEKGLLVVSGLAKGIDSKAHEGSLESGTLAFLGCGANVIYPKENKKLFEEIIERGAVVSEYSNNTQPLSINFPKRNRLIAGVSRGVLVIEASLNSGSLITAEIAKQNNRTLFAVPSNPLDTKSKGANYLIKDGAVLTESIDDIMPYIENWQKTSFKIKEDIKSTDTIEVDFENFISKNDSKIASAKEKIKNSLSFVPISIDLIISNTKISENIVSLVILELELNGSLVRVPGNKVVLIK